jgi:hypothetical protein
MAKEICISDNASNIGQRYQTSRISKECCCTHHTIIGEPEQRPGILWDRIHVRSSFGTPPHQRSLSILLLFPTHETYKIIEPLRFSYLPISTCLWIIIPPAVLSCKLCKHIQIPFRTSSVRSIPLWYLCFPIYFSVIAHMNTYPIHSVIVTCTRNACNQIRLYILFFRYILITVHICWYVLIKNNIFY